MANVVVAIVVKLGGGASCGHSRPSNVGRQRDVRFGDSGGCRQRLSRRGAGGETESSRLTADVEE